MRHYLLRVASVLALVGLFCIAAGRAQVPLVASYTPSPSGSSFTGVGDVQSGWAFWYGVIPYSAAYAAANGNAFFFSCNSGAITGSVAFQSNGKLNLSPLSSCVGTITVTQSAGGATILYDQSGANNCAGSGAPFAPQCNTNTPTGTLVFLQSGCPATSVITYCFQATGYNSTSPNSTLGTQTTITMSTILDRPTSGSFNAGVGYSSADMGADSAANTAFLYNGGAIPTTTMSDNVLHTEQGTNGTSGNLIIDNNSSVTANSGSGTVVSGRFYAGGANTFTGYLYGGGVYAGALSTTVQANIAHNECVNSGSTAAPTC